MKGKTVHTQRSGTQYTSIAHLVKHTCLETIIFFVDQEKRD